MSCPLRSDEECVFLGCSGPLSLSSHLEVLAASEGSSEMVGLMDTFKAELPHSGIPGMDGTVDSRGEVSRGSRDFGFEPGAAVVAFDLSRCVLASEEREQAEKKRRKQTSQR